jgi:hypothetical protein
MPLAAQPTPVQPAPPQSPPRLSSPQPILLAPVHEGGVLKNRGINIPLNTALAPEQRLAFGYTAANSYLNPGRLCRFTDSVCEVAYETDHTGNLWFVDLRQPLFGFWELGVGLGTYRMDRIPDLAVPHRFARDRALRVFHEDVLGEDSLPTLSGAPDGRQLFALEDPAGRDLVLAAEHTYALPLRLDLVRYVDIRGNERAHLGINLGMHLSYPLEGDPAAAIGQTAFARGMDFGVSVNFVRAVRTTANLTSSFHVQLARFRSDLDVLNPNSPVNGDDPLRSQYALTYGLHFAGTFGGRAPCAFSMGQVTNTAHYDKDRYWAWDLVYAPGGDNLRGSLAGANDFGVMTFGCERRAALFQVAVVEDIAGLSQFVSDDGSGPSYDPDLAVSVSVSWSLASGRGGSAD